MVNGRLISIIIPVFNAKPYLSEAIDSVLQQTYQNIEIILVNDGSTDGSGEVCDWYAGKDNRIRVIHQINGGLSAARNAGLNVMTGEAVAFLDADDAYIPEYVQNLVHLMISEEADIALCKYAVCYTKKTLNRAYSQKGAPGIKQGTYNYAEGLKYLTNGEINHSVWNKLYKRELWREIRFPDGHVYEDVDTTYRILNICKKICVVDKVLYLHRRHQKSISGTCSQEYITDWLNACYHFNSFVFANISYLTQDDVNRMYNVQINQMIAFYGRAPRKLRTERELLDGTVRRKILDDVKHIGAGNLTHATRTCYLLLRSCPAIFRFLYIIAYTSIHHVKRVIQPISRLYSKGFP